MDHQHDTTVSAETGPIGALTALIFITSVLQVLVSVFQRTKRLRKKLGKKYANPKLKNNIEKIEKELSHLEKVSKLMSERGLREGSIEATNGFIVGKDGKSYLKHLDHEYARFSALSKSIKGPMETLRQLNDKIDESGEDDLDNEEALDKQIEVVGKLIAKHWVESDDELTSKLMESKNSITIATPTPQEAVTILKLGGYFTNIKAEFAELPYSNYAQQIGSSVYEVQRHLDGIIKGIADYISASTK